MAEWVDVPLVRLERDQRHIDPEPAIRWGPWALDWDGMKAGFRGKPGLH